MLNVGANMEHKINILCFRFGKTILKNHFKCENKYTERQHHTIQADNNSYFVTRSTWTRFEDIEVIKIIVTLILQCIPKESVKNCFLNLY